MHFREKQTGSLIGVAIGDALGLPVEAHTRRQIVSLLDRETLGDHDSLLSEYYPIGRHAMYRPYIAGGAYPFLQSGARGICSDDTLLTLAIADSIQARGGVDMDDMVMRHVELVQSEPFGFGNGTRTTMEKIGGGADWRSINEASFGNGLMMKQSPFAFLEANSGTDYSRYLEKLSRITHAHPVSLVAAIIHHKLLIDIIFSFSGSFDMRYWLREGIGLARLYERRYGAGSHISELLGDMHDEAWEDISLEDISSRYARKIGDEKNPYFNILSTLGICYAIFLRNQDFTAVRQGASIGGDTDSYASILGSMVGALHGNVFDKKLYEAIHPRYKQKLDTTLKN